MKLKGMDASRLDHGIIELTMTLCGDQGFLNISARQIAELRPFECEDSDGMLPAIALDLDHAWTADSFAFLAPVHEHDAGVGIGAEHILHEATVDAEDDRGLLRSRPASRIRPLSPSKEREQGPGRFGRSERPRVPDHWRQRRAHSGMLAVLADSLESIPRDNG